MYLVSANKAFAPCAGGRHLLVRALAPPCGTGVMAALEEITCAGQPTSACHRTRPCFVPLVSLGGTKKGFKGLSSLPPAPPPALFPANTAQHIRTPPSFPLA
ncbi:unnamed protein product [Ectocarpus sp. 8 AP-2014]